MSPLYRVLNRSWINSGRSLSRWMWVALALMASGCARTEKEALLPQTGPTMREVYEQHFQGGGSGSRQTDPQPAAPVGRARHYGEGLSDLAGYTLTSATETRRIFQRLPNPDLVMYVFPHLAGPEQVPIPGYTTTFPFYDRVRYALPGEVED